MRRQRKLSIDPALRDDFGRRLRSWYRRNARDLPWRRTRSPYEVLVSELMLQQTQVSRVITKYGEFLGQFPTLGHVARAPSGRVTEAWEGLGYYARARNLHRLAVEVTEGGSAERQLPADPAALRALPGVGAYTAGAVASFASPSPSRMTSKRLGTCILRATARGDCSDRASRIACAFASVCPASCHRSR
jgi:A/G-specific adenine glycosylase